MKAIDQLLAQIPDHIHGLSPYQGGLPTDVIARRIGMPEAQIVKLASNENPLGMSPKAQAAVAAQLPQLGRYPDGDGAQLKAAIAQRFGLAPGQVLLGNGSNDILELVAEAFLRPGRSAVMSDHAFAVYSLATTARGGERIVVPATPAELGHDLPAMARAVRADTAVVWVANPNNPTGSYLPPSEIRAFLADLPSSTLMVLDEAYTEYLSPEESVDTLAWTAEHANLIVSRSFSKAYGLAGLRVGFGAGDPQLIERLNRIRQPFNVNLLAQAAALAALGDDDFLHASRRVNAEGDAQLREGLAAVGLSALPSKGNFLLIDLAPQAARIRALGTGEALGPALFSALLSQGVITRPVANYGLPSHLRVSIGTRAENARFLAVLHSLLGGPAA